MMQPHPSIRYSVYSQAPYNNPSRARRVKCDEQRPACRRCTSTGRKCDGYQPIQSLQVAILSNPRDLRSYHYFWKQVLPLLPGHYDHLFWGIWVRQVCFAEPAIQYAMIAVGVLHESITSKCAGDGDAAEHQRGFSVQKYNKAIECLTETRASRLPAQIVLTCCLIFIVFENMYGRNSEASKHLKSGLAILGTWVPSTHSESVVREEYLTPVFTRGYKQQDLDHSLMTFANLEAARKHLQILLDLIYADVDLAMLSKDAVAVAEKSAGARHSLHRWYMMFASVETPRDNEGRRAKILLRLQFETASILLAAAELENEVGHDRYMHTFQAIVDQCEQLVDLEGIVLGKSAADPTAFTYGFDLNILPPLNITAFKCRDPQLRRRAIELLEAGNRFEGLWNGKTVARIARKTMELEEAGLVAVNSCADVPEWARMRLMTLAYNPGYEEHIGTPRDEGERRPTTAHYSIEWSRNMVNGQPLESVRDYVTVSDEEKSSSWGPGRVPWQMVFQYNLDWAQWRLSFSAQERRRSAEPTATEGHETRNIGAQAASSLVTTQKLRSAVKKHDCLGGAGSGQQINLFWDHWRLRTLPRRESRESATAIRKEATRGGRSYGDAQDLEGGGTQPSHLLISLP